MAGCFSDLPLLGRVALLGEQFPSESVLRTAACGGLEAEDQMRALCRLVPNQLLVSACVGVLFFRASGDMSLVSLQGVDPGAVCADGSPAGYYFESSKSSSELGSRLWILYLEGGDWCFDEESCRRRCKHSTGPLCSSKRWPATYQHGAHPCGNLNDTTVLCGLFAPKPSLGAGKGALASANRALLRYCTSDAHMGDASAFGFQFRGARVVKAVIKDLVQRHGLGLKNSQGREDTLIFAGGSAGARGVMVHLDYVSDMLGRAANAVKVVGFMDSPLWVQMPAFDSHHHDLGELVTETKTMHQFANVTNLGNACAARYKAEEWKCLFAEYRMPFVKSRYLLVASQYDQFQLGSYIGHKPVTPKELDFAAQFGRRTLAVVENLVSDRHAVLSWACYNHMLSLSDRFSKDATEDGVTLMNATEQFLGLVPREEGKELAWIDRCHGFDCGKNCYRPPLRRSFSIGSPFNAGGRPTLGSARGSNDGQGPDLPAEEQEAGEAVSISGGSDGLSEEAQILARLEKTAQPVVATTTTAMPATASTTEPAHQAVQAAHDHAKNSPDAAPGATITVQEFHARMTRAPSILAVNITFGRMGFNRLRSDQREAIRSTLVKECAAVAAVHTSAVKDVDGMSQSISLAPVEGEDVLGKGFVAKALIDVPREQSTDDIMTVFSFYSMRQRIAAALSRLWTDNFDPAFIHVSCEKKSTAAFVSVDVDHDGALDLGELFSATKVSDPPMTGLQAEYVFGQLDVDFNGKLSPEEYEVIVDDAKQNTTTTPPASTTSASGNAANRGGHPKFAKATTGEADTEDQRLNVTITSQGKPNPTTTSPASTTSGNAVNRGDHPRLTKATTGEADTKKPDQRLNMTITSQERSPQSLPSSMIMFGALLSLMVPQCLWFFVSNVCPKKQRRFMETCGETSPKSQEAQFGVAQQANFSSSLTGEAYQARQTDSQSIDPPSVIEELANFFRCHAVGPTAYPRPGLGLAV